jgi:hypothetical protein
MQDLYENNACSPDEQVWTGLDTTQERKLIDSFVYVRTEFLMFQQ